MLFRNARKYFSLEILSQLHLTEGFYSAVQNRLIPKEKCLKLEILPGGKTHKMDVEDLHINSIQLKQILILLQTCKINKRII